MGDTISCFTDNKLPTLPFTPLHHLPRRIARAQRRCFVGSIQVGRAAFSTQHQPFYSWWSGSSTNNMEAQSTNKAYPEAAGQEGAATEEDGRLDESAYDSDGLSAIDRQYATQTDLPRGIHVLGATGSIGKLVAHSLKGLTNPPPITLLLHRYKLIEAWEEVGERITLQDNGHEVPRTGFSVELMRENRREHDVEVEFGKPNVYDTADRADIRPHEAAERMKQEQAQMKMENGGVITKTLSGLKGDKYMSDEPIHNLIVTVKAAQTSHALQRISHRLLPTSTICFLQNGMGMIDDVNKEVFPDEQSRPNYVQGIITHGANVPPTKAEQDPFYVVHAGHGTIALGLLPRAGVVGKATTAEAKDGKDTQNEKWAISSRYLLRTLTRSPVLCAIGFTPTELLQQQLEKLAVNSIINPLTVLIDNRNGALLYNFAFTRTIRLMLAETSHVIRLLPELQGVPNVNIRFSPERLESLVFSLANRTKDNISSMLADMRAGRKTEIEYINGYIVRRGEELGIKCVVNYSIMQAVIGKTMMVDREKREDVPREGQMFLE